ncbi:GNAT family N-acetyltransferase [Streptomonospora sediminis]
METSLATKTHGGVPTLRYRYLGSADVDQLAGLWAALHEQHSTTAPHLEDIITRVNADESWRRRRAQYLAWLNEPETLAVVAERGGESVGYAMVTIRENEQGSWDRGSRVAVVQTLSVHPDHEGTGVGSGLLEELRRQVGAMGIRDLELTALATSSEDIRFFEQEGFRPFVTTMVSRIGGVGGHD